MAVFRKKQDDGYQISVDNSETKKQSAVAEATEDTYTQEEYDAATYGMISQDAADELVEAAVAAATEGMYTQAEYDSNALECTAIST